MKLKDVRFAVLGMARSGLAAAVKIQELGGKVFVSEFKKETDITEADKIRTSFDCEFGGHSSQVLDNDLIIVSPGIPLDIPILKQARQTNIELISEIELGFRIKHPNSRIIAVTGSNGKSTTVSLIHHILQLAGFNSILAGNIGTAFTSYPIEKPEIDFIVLELSSFQLELIDKFKADVAVLLNISPDHLNRYNNMAEYALTKFNIFKNQTRSDLAVINSADVFSQKYRNKISAEIRQFSSSGLSDVILKDDFIKFQTEKISLRNAILKGPHNLENMMAALLSVSKLNISETIIETAFATFTPLPHRLEFVAQINEIKFYNDSKATNTDAVKYALQSFPKPIRLIMGGAGKGEDYTILNDLIRKHVKKLYLVGNSSQEMAVAFKNVVDFDRFDSYQDVINAAYHEAESGDIIVLSPACTSYDMFANFEERGNYFKKLVRELKT